MDDDCSVCACDEKRLVVDAFYAYGIYDGVAFRMDAHVDVDVLKLIWRVFWRRLARSKVGRAQAWKALA